MFDNVQAPTRPLGCRVGLQRNQPKLIIPLPKQRSVLCVLGREAGGGKAQEEFLSTVWGSLRYRSG